MNRNVVGLVLALATLLPTAAACEGLSPGDNLIVENSSCTLAFLVADPTGLYFMTAGHCVGEGQRAYSPALEREFGTGAFTFLEGESANGEGSPGNDFALIRIDTDLYEQLNPKMCGWDGPKGGVFREATTSGTVRHYGYGLVFGDVGPTRAREGVNLYYESGSAVFLWTGAGVPGDSGSAVIHENGQALGILTHLGGSGLVNGQTNTGLHMDRAFQLASDAGYRLRLVEVGEDPVAVLREVAGGTLPPPDAEPTPPTGGNSTQPTPTTPTPTSPTNPGNGTAPSASPPPRDEPADGGDGLDAATTDDARNPVPGFAAPLLVVGALAVAAMRRRR